MRWRVHRRSRLVLFVVGFILTGVVYLLFRHEMVPTHVIGPLGKFVTPAEISDGDVAEFLNSKYPLVYAKGTKLNETVFKLVFSSNDEFLGKLQWKMADRCKFYFDTVLASAEAKEEMLVDPDNSFRFDRLALFGYEKWLEEQRQRRWDMHKDKIIQEKKEEYRMKQIAEGNWKEGTKVTEKDINWDDSMITDFDEDNLKQDLDTLWGFTKNGMDEDHNRLRDYLSHSRVYNRCFLQLSHPKQLADVAFVNDQKLWSPRWLLSGSRPTRHHQWLLMRDLEAKVYPWLEGVSPKVVDVKLGKIRHLQVDQRHTWLSGWRRKLSGRGLVLTISDEHVEDSVRLVALLHKLGNTLPIQIIHHSDQLLDENIDLLRKAAVKYEQSISMVDVTRSVNPAYLQKFKGFGNKILATLFNTFSEMILVDADTVFVEPPQSFFNLNRYRQLGTLFFKDRANAEFRLAGDIPWFRHLFPTQMDTAMFNIPQVSNHTTQLMFFTDRFMHYMESGVVLIDRTVHYEQPLVMAVMNWFYAMKLRVYGDKELFWLSLSVMGDENYQFNNHHAAAVGQLTPPLELPPQATAKEICLNHPGHISDEDDRLLWFNSGFRHCGMLAMVDFDTEFKAKLRYTKFQKVADFRTFFESKLDIVNAIIPPYKQLIAPNDKGEPHKAWIHMKAYCHQYTWCGYNVIGGSDNPDHHGRIITFSDDDRKRFSDLGDAWMKANVGDVS